MLSFTVCVVLELKTVALSDVSLRTLGFGYYNRLDFVITKGRERDFFVDTLLFVVADLDNDVFAVEVLGRIPRVCVNHLPQNLLVR